MEADALILDQRKFTVGAAAALLVAAGVALLPSANPAAEMRELALVPYMNLAHAEVIAVLEDKTPVHGAKGTLDQVSLEIGDFAFACPDASYELIADGGLLIGGHIFCALPDAERAAGMAQELEDQLSTLPGWTLEKDKATDPRRAEEYGRSIPEAFEWVATRSDPFESVPHVPLSNWKMGNDAFLELYAAIYRKAGDARPQVQVDFGFPIACLFPLMVFRNVPSDSADWDSPLLTEVKAHFGNRPFESMPEAERSRLSDSYAKAACAFP